MTRDAFFDEKNNILRNVWGLTDPDELQRRETFHSANRMETLPKAPLTFPGYKRLHKHIFQDIYPWAGQVRPTTLAKRSPDGRVVSFLPPRLIEANLRQVFQDIEHGKALRGLTRESFAEIAAEALDRVNHTHAFREGNGRTQRALLWRMGEEAGHRIRIRSISPPRWMGASIASDRDTDHTPMQSLILDAISESLPMRRRSLPGQPAAPSGAVPPAAQAADGAAMGQGRPTGSPALQALQAAVDRIAAHRGAAEARRQLFTELGQLREGLAAIESWQMMPATGSASWSAGCRRFTPRLVRPRRRCLPTSIPTGRRPRPRFSTSNPRPSGNCWGAHCPAAASGAKRARPPAGSRGTCRHWGSPGRPRRRRHHGETPAPKPRCRSRSACNGLRCRTGRRGRSCSHS